MKIKQERYDELISSENKLALLTRAYNEMTDFNFFNFCTFLFDESADKKLREETMSVHMPVHMPVQLNN